MRRRLTVAILLLVAATLVVSGIASYYFIRRAAISTAQQELVVQAQAISRTLSEGTIQSRAGITTELGVIRRAGAFTSLQLLELHPGGSISGMLTPSLLPRQLNLPALQRGDQTAGSTGTRGHLMVFTAIPTPIAAVTATTPLLVITRRVHDPASGLHYFTLIGAIALVVAAVVASGLASLFTRPLEAAVAATRRIAGGDVGASVPVAPHDYPEIAQLSRSINVMGQSLARAREQERQFLMSVSHELRTPLTSIRGYAEAIEDGAATDPVGAARIISTEARRLERLVQDLLDLARLDADRFSLDLGPVDLGDIARQAAESFAPRADEIGLELGVVPDHPERLWVQADADRLGQVVANLLENAATFATGRIVVGTGSAGGAAVVWVSDDGPGIASAELSRVFERHFSSDRVVRRRKGSGLGLAIVAELSAAMGAEVRAESPVLDGRGTRMAVWFGLAGGPPPEWPGRSALPGG